jgi:ATP phosphoribosyltransferase regulatory subunit
VTIYAPGRHEELGRGGRYVCGDNEPATGLTLFPDAVLRAAPPRTARQRLYVPSGTDQDEAAQMRRLGYATIAALASEHDPVAEARRLLCTHILRNGSAVPLTSGI